MQCGPETAHDFRISSIYVGERLGYWPDELRDVDFGRRQKTDDHASEHRRQHDIAPRILGFLGERGNPVEANVCEHGNGRASKEAAECEGLRVVKRPGKEGGIGVRMAEDVASGDYEDYHHNGAHACSHARVNACRRLNAANIQERKDHRKKSFPDPNGDSWREVMGLSCAPHRAD